ncbi:hypothetical protein DFH28DRAFT_1169769 [Melampsora americana]|nr:hypothetical protein DFH28DRAFT_1169769 [Melampsora americana]
MTSHSNPELLANFHDQSVFFQAAATPNAPKPMLYYVEVLLSLSKGGFHPTTNVTRNFLWGAHRPSISLNEYARKMEKTSRAIARHAAVISNTLRQVNDHRVHKRQRMPTTSTTPDQKTSKQRRTQDQPVHANFSRKRTSRPCYEVTKDPVRVQNYDSVRANLIKYCGLTSDEHDLKDNLLHGSFLGETEDRQSNLLEKKSS